MPEGPHLSSSKEGEIAAPIPQSRRRRMHRSKHHAYGSAQRGRVWLVLIFFAMRAADVLLFSGMPPGKGSEILGSIITSAIWTTALLVGMWLRKNWCRYFLIFILLVTFFLSAFMIYDIGLSPHVINLTVVYILVAVTLIHGAIALALILSKDIKRLTSRVRD